MSVKSRYFISFLTFVTVLVITTFATGKVVNPFLSKKVKSDAEKEIKRVKDSAFNLADTSSGLSELCFTAGNCSNLSNYLEKKAVEKLFYKAFFVTKEGKILAHSDSAEASELDYNIASDEIGYNIDQIFYVLNNGANSPLVDDYNIIGYKVPFKADEIRFIKNNIYNAADKNGLIASKAVISNGVNVGTINFIFTKEKVYSSIKKGLRFKKKILISAYVISGILSLATCLIVFSVIKPSLSVSNVSTKVKPSGEIKSLTGKETGVPEIVVLERGPVEAELIDAVEIFLPGENLETTKEETILIDDKQLKRDSKIYIRDAIPITDNRGKQ